jgi:LPS sulfotransferase NodH
MTPPTRFVLLGHPRSGSTLVTLALQQHPDVRMFGEVFHVEFLNRLIAYRWGVTGRPSLLRSRERTEAWVCTEHHDGAQFLDDLVYGDPSPDRPDAIGFKLFYDHARHGRTASAWDYLREQRDVRVVHLVRANLLECLVSTRTAELTNVWEVDEDEGTPGQPPPLRLTATECTEYFERLTTLRDRADGDLGLSHRQVLEIEYERDVHHDFDSTMRRVQHFLGVPAATLPMRLRKLSTRPVHERVANFAELADHFRDTRFRAFFEPSEVLDGHV